MTNWFIKVLVLPYELGGFQALGIDHIKTGGWALLCQANGDVNLQLFESQEEMDEHMAEMYEAFAAMFFGFTDIPLLADDETR